MGYRSLEDAVRDLDRTGQLVRIADPVNPNLEVAEIQRRLYRNAGPAVLFEQVAGTEFRMLGNMFGTLDRARFLFRDTLDAVRLMIQAKIDPAQIAKRPGTWLRLARAGLTTLPQRVRTGPVLECETTLSKLPQLKSWPADGGPFVTLPLVFTEDPRSPGWPKSNLGMYRVQIAGNEFVADREVGLHYQIHRGIGVHHTAAAERGEPLGVNIFVGGPPAMTVSAVMPLPEGLSELIFAGALGGRRIRLASGEHKPAVWVDADFCISGTIDPQATKPEGPFGDHLGYYSLTHDFPVMRVHKVWHRPRAIWPFTTVGRPPQEDTVFGELIHEITGPVIPSVLPGVKAVHAVDAAGVHPLLLAIGSERYTPYQKTDRPQELLTQANAILGQGQLSLAKYLLIVAQQDNPELDIHNIDDFLVHLLERVDWRRDLHFQTSTTIDTLDYSGYGSGRLNQGSKLVIAAVGPKRRTLPTEVPAGISLPDGFSDARVCLPGILAVKSPRYEKHSGEVEASVSRFVTYYDEHAPINAFPLIVLVDDSGFTSQTLNNLLWTVFTRSNPAADVHGIASDTFQKHWHCRGSLVIDARLKPYQAPPLVEDPEVTRRVDRLFQSGGPLAQWDD
jgi:4-hydroxy-3-polyprenylbenzoate decarboxylase